MNNKIEMKHKTKGEVYHIKSNTDFLKISDVIFDRKKFIDLCKTGCPDFNKSYSCPPYSPSFEEISRPYECIVVNMMRIYLDNSGQKPDTTQLINNILKNIQRKIFDRIYYDMKSNNIDTYVLESGTCRLCNICELQKEQSCKYPEKMRFSLEATGIDVGDLLKKVFNFELKWFKNGKLPEYQSIVGGFLTNNPEKVIDSCNKFVGLKLS